MPPYELWLQGHASIAEWLLSFGLGCRGSILVPVEACGGTPAFAQYRRMGEWPWALILLDVDGDRIMGMTSYLDVETLFPRLRAADAARPRLKPQPDSDTLRSAREESGVFRRRDR